MKEETPHQIKEVVMKEYYSKENGTVYWNIRLQGGNWIKYETPYKELPWKEIKSFQ